MKQFIKFTNLKIRQDESRPFRVLDEIIIDIDSVGCMSAIDGNFVITATLVANYIGDLVHFDLLVSKEDYEYAKSLLLGNDQSITPTDGNDAGPAIETLENDADPATKEKELLKRVMDEFNNNIVGASMRLGMSVNVLRRKLKTYGLPCK